jgi:hypothetical protein
MLDMLLHGLLSYVQGIRDFLVSPPLGEVFNDRLFAVRELKFLFSLVGVQMLTPSQLFHGHNHSCVLDATFIR